MNGATVKEGPKWEVGRYKTLSAKLVEYIDIFLFTENIIDSAHVSITLNFCFLCLDALKHLTWTSLPCIHPKFVTREVFSHSSSEGGEILGPSLLQNYLQMWVEGCVTESCAIRFMNGSPSLRKCAGICVIRMYVCVIRLCETDGLTCMCNVNM